MNFSHPQIVMQEIPGEITLALSISGCPLKCPGCHSAFTWDPSYGKQLNQLSLSYMLNQYRGMITCVLFYGGEWDLNHLIPLLQFIRSQGLLTALYSGLDELPEKLVKELDFLKTGPYISHLGGLESPYTNQRLINTKTGEILNHHFLQPDEKHTETWKKAI